MFQQWWELMRTCNFPSCSKAERKRSSSDHGIFSCFLGPVHMNPGQWTTPGQRLPRGKCYLVFTWWFVVPGQCCPGSTSLPRCKFKVIWSSWNCLNCFSFYTNCYREWIVNMFTYFWCFLKLFIGKFIPNINNEHAPDYSCPGTTFAFCWHEEELRPVHMNPGQWTTPG